MFYVTNVVWQDHSVISKHLILHCTRMDLTKCENSYQYQGIYKKFVKNVFFFQVVGRAFIETGLQRHHSVAIIGANSPEWIICNMAAIMAG